MEYGAVKQYHYRVRRIAEKKEFVTLAVMCRSCTSGQPCESCLDAIHQWSAALDTFFPPELQSLGTAYGPLKELVR